MFLESTLSNQRKDTISEYFDEKGFYRKYAGADLCVAFKSPLFSASATKNLFVSISIYASQ